ncbi:hypothetical protein NQ318_001385 [Aromia moschata]|uniref:Cilia- and flagella-associated protein 69 ARM repeats domain-containing protein n=1 Tax=Aromia moschata TaxID=1265417 RepID=A0AAV8YX15_9CUCU|nr:hypothetical protein NQ318_001385 [Aromia moschata]
MEQEGMLDICKIPPLLTVPSEVLTYARDLHEYFSMLGYLLVCLKIEKLQNEVAHTLISLLTKDFPNFRFILSLNVRKKCAENSRLPEILGQMLEIGEENIYPKILEIIILMATESDMTCK